MDYRNGGQYSLGVLQEELDELPIGLSAASGNGRHIYVNSNLVLSNAVNVRGLSGIDIKSSGSVVVAPCSTHASGNEYRWEVVGEPGALPESWVLNLTGGGGSSVRVGTRIGHEAPLPVKLEPGYVIHKGARNETLFRFASRERGRGADYHQILDFIEKVNDAHCNPPLPVNSLQHIAKSASKYLTEAEKRRRRRWDGVTLNN